MIKLNRKTIFVCLGILLGLRSAIVLPKTEQDYFKTAETGDIIFQTQVGKTQSFAIQVATLSPYNHVGVIVKSKGKIYVYEANGPVKKNTLEQFVARRGTANRFVVYRHKDINEKKKLKIVKYVKRQVGKPYDVYLKWDSNALYCSELAHKTLDYAGLDLNKPKQIKDMSFALTVGHYIPNNYKINELKKEESVVAPSHLSRDNHLEKVFQNW